MFQSAYKSIEIQNQYAHYDFNRQKYTCPKAQAMSGGRKKISNKRILKKLIKKLIKN